MNRTILLFLSLFAGCSAPYSAKTPLEMISFNGGYAQESHFQIFGRPYDPEAFLAGMVAARSGQPRPFSNEEFEQAAVQFEKEHKEAQKTKNLADANTCLTQVASNPTIREWIPEMLYSQTIRTETEPAIADGEFLYATYRVSCLCDGQEKEILQQTDAPVLIAVADTIPGFAKGVANITIGERRKIFIHPDLAYGSYDSCVGPNQLLIIEVEAMQYEHPHTVGRVP